MENIQVPIFVTTTFVFMVNIMPFLGFGLSVIATCLFFAPFVVFWMVYRTLKDGVPSKNTFETHWYDDE